MDTLFADSEADKLIEDARENSTMRLVKNLINVKDVCRGRVKLREPLTYVGIAKECVEKFGKPSEGTIDNDTRGYFKPLIKLYQELVSPSETFKDDALNELPIDIKIYIKQLEKRNDLLEKIQKQMTAEANRTEVHSVTETVELHDGLSDHARVVKSTEQLASGLKKAFKRLYGVIEYAEEELIFQGEEGSERLVSKSTGVILLTPTEVRDIKKAIS